MKTNRNAAQEAAREALTDICHMAASIRRLCVLAIEAGGESDEAADLSAAARDLAAQLGWKADMALRALGDHGVVGGAEAWMMPEWPEPAGTTEGRLPAKQPPEEPRYGCEHGKAKRQGNGSHGGNEEPLEHPAAHVATVRGKQNHAHEGHDDEPHDVLVEPSAE